MSIFNEVVARCGKCGNEKPVQLAASINVDRRPDLRAAVLDGSFQGEICDKCGSQMRLPAACTYMDMGRGQWILVENYDGIKDWATSEAYARGLFDTSFGASAPEPAQDVGAGMWPRLVFGWPALREKLIAGDLSLQDLSLELLKMQILRNVPNSPLSDDTELRLVGGNEAELHFSWIESESEAPLNGLSVPRAVYQDIDEQPEDWYELREKFDGALFVDMKRLLVPAL